MYGFTEMMMEEAEKQFSQEGRETMTKERLAIREAIHAMKWLDQHFKGWGLEEECAILENICSNYEKKEIQTNHNYLDLQYQLDGAESEIERLREEIKILKMGEKVANELILRGRAAEERIEELENEIERLRALRSDIITIINRPKTTSDKGLLLYVRAEVDYNTMQAAKIRELEDQIHKIARQYICNSDYWQDRAKKAESKIRPDADHIVGPDQMVPNGKVWQITEERKAAIDRGLQFLEWSYAKNSALDTKEQIAVLWAMLDEVGQYE